MDKYIYEGPVKIFDNIVAENWKAETMACSESKARANFAYQYKKGHNLTPHAKVSITGKITKKGM